MVLLKKQTKCCPSNDDDGDGTKQMAAATAESDRHWNRSWRSKSRVTTTIACCTRIGRPSRADTVDSMAAATHSTNVRSSV
jgi:hypothetical protein